MTEMVIFAFGLMEEICIIRMDIMWDGQKVASFTIATMMLLVLRLIIHSISLQTLEMVAIQAFLV